MTSRPWFRPMRHGVGVGPASWQGWGVVAVFALLLAALPVPVFALVADPMLAAVFYMAAAGMLAVGLFLFAQWLARGG